ncbi:DUF4167 domain-containing protein [Roseovarius sp. LXJ103]|uniref:DUF4167 domain-containing protein n=1 Tax=Roseovarius carneus TaxID=2853164 RepID=UPI000D61BF84|nr:DUF4167 domain-containing protein [Roseovarius carneus]MBZ8119607.1 DUF4167 domain-containing protein [Roseovarius carneus]PWE34773.1 DUF4167 domain-containing protein [Pelagicola sp. LXJ1103]
MRSSKSRSRNKSNRNRSSNTVGNVVNRVFDSSGPEGKVRGTPQQIIEKYNQLARDAQLSNDRVATENFQQHAEHYLRLLSAAQKEIDAKRDQQERENRDRQAERDKEQRDRPQRHEHDAESGGKNSGQHSGQYHSQQSGQGEQPQHTSQEAEDSSILVETPETQSEAKSEAPPKARAPRKPRRKPTPEMSAAKSDSPTPPEAAE